MKQQKERVRIRLFECAARYWFFIGPDNNPMMKTYGHSKEQSIWRAQMGGDSEEDLIKQGYQLKRLRLIYFDHLREKSATQPGSVVEKWGDIAWALDKGSDIFIGGILVENSHARQLTFEQLNSFLITRKIRIPAV